MPIKFDLPQHEDSIIKVIGVGGGGSNAVNHMYKQGIVGVNFAICNTDEQAMAQSSVPVKIALGPGLTDGRGAGSKPEIGKNASIESMDDIKNALSGNTKMVFITAGMGGGTGTGGAPVVAKAARELGILTVGIVTTPFFFEGRKRIQQAMKGIEELKENVDTLIVISNDKLRELYSNLSLSEAFGEADNILTTAAKGIAEIITVPGYVNVDFEDVNTVMKQSGVAIMGTGVADGEDRALKAVKMALASPLLNDNDIRGAKHILLNITSGTREVLMDEVSDITSYIQEAAGYTSEVIWGNCTDEKLSDKISVTVIATGFETKQQQQQLQNRPVEKVVFSLDGDDPKPKEVKRPIVEATQQPEEENALDLGALGYDFEKQAARSKFNREHKQEADNYMPNYHRKNNDPEAERKRIFMERRKRLRGLSMKLESSNLNDLEKEPAYKRRNVELEELPHSSESNVSKYSLFEEEKNKPEIKKRNPYLHDKLD